MSNSYLVNDPLARESVAQILKWQNESGAYVACPTFPQYGYAWLRDGAFCALAMHLSGQTDSASRFNSWVSSTVAKYQNLFVDGMQRLEDGRQILPENSPPTRFHMDGSVEIDHHEVWPNYQLDGYGTWLAVLNLTATVFSDPTLSAVKIVADFLAVAWKQPCYDCWEEGGDLIHGSTLLSIAGGLKAAAEITGNLHYLAEYERVIASIESDFIIDGHFVKNSNDPQIDASLAWAALPHRAYEATHPVVLRTVDIIKEQLQNSKGGVKRYLGDSYYGGGDWVLLEGLVAWNDAVKGDRTSWEASKEWFSSVASSDLLLPEQVLQDAQDHKMISPWEERWGGVANPLLWSHAMYLLMLHEGAKQNWI